MHKRRHFKRLDFVWTSYKRYLSPKCQDEGMGNVINLDPDPSDMSKQEQSYDEVVKEFIIDEKKYLRDLHMITKVFR